MNRLIKNEFIKVFSKKALLIICLLVIGYAFLQYKISDDNVTESVYSVDNLISDTKEVLDSYDLDNTADKSDYIYTYSSLENYYVMKEFGLSSWQYIEYMNSDQSDIVTDYITAKLNGDDASYEEGKKNHEEYLDKLRNNEYSTFAKEELEEAKANKALDEELLKDADDLTKRELEKEIYSLDVDIETLEYRIDYNIPIASDDTIALFAIYAKNYSNYDKDEDSYKTKSSLTEFRTAKSDYYISKYKMEHEMFNSITGSTYVCNSMSYVSFFAIIVISIIAGSIVSEEFNKGTIKQLLLKPYTRTQILLSKLIVSLIVFFLFIIFLFGVNCILYGTLYGFKTLADPIVIYNYATDTVITKNLIVASLEQFTALLPCYLILLLTAFAVSTIFKKDSISFACTVGLYVVGDLISAFTSTSTSKIISFLPFTCWNLSSYLYGGISSIQYASLSKSLIIDAVCIIVLLVLPFVVFNKTNIKNQ